VEVLNQFIPYFHSYFHGFFPGRGVFFLLSARKGKFPFQGSTLRSLDFFGKKPDRFREKSAFFHQAVGPLFPPTKEGNGFFDP